MRNPGLPVQRAVETRPTHTTHAAPRTSPCRADNLQPSSSPPHQKHTCLKVTQPKTEHPRQTEYRPRRQQLKEACYNMNAGGKTNITKFWSVDTSFVLVTNLFGSPLGRSRRICYLSRMGRLQLYVSSYSLQRFTSRPRHSDRQTQ